VRSRASVIAIALAALIAGCGGGGHAQKQGRQDVAYVKRINAIEAQLHQPLVAVTQASAQFGSKRKAGPVVTADRGTRAQEKTLNAARVRIRSLGESLAAIPAPPAYAKLRTLLVRLVNQQAYLTEQTAKLVVFLPSFDSALRPLAPATVRLERALSVTQAYGPSAVQAVYARKAHALRTFHSDVERVLVHLRHLSAPQVSAPDFDAQVDALHGMSVDAGKLADAIGSGQTTNVAGLLQNFDKAAVSNQTVHVQKAQIAAVKAYDRQVSKLNSLAVAAERERLRLASTLPQ
jgi:hypothetical protein